MPGRFPLRSFTPAPASTPYRVRPRFAVQEPYKAAEQTTHALLAEYNRIMHLFSPTWPSPGQLILDNPAADPNALEHLANQLTGAGLAPRDYQLRALAAQVRAHRAKRSAPGGAPLQPSTGTIFGKHSLGETKELLGHTNFRFIQTEKALQALIQRAVALREQGQPINEAALAAIANDWGKLLPKWRTDAKRFASELVRIGRYYPLNSPATVATEDVWKELVLYLRPEPDDFAKGTLPDIARRIEAMGQPIDLSEEQRTEQKDFDFELFGDLTAVTKQMEAAAAAVKQTTKSTFEEFLPLIITGGVLGVIVLGVLYAPEIRGVIGLTKKAARR